MIQEEITSKNAPQPIGPYSPAIKIGDFLYLSGQIGIDPETGKLIDGGIQEQTRRCIMNLQAVLQEKGLALGHVVKTTVFLKDMSQFSGMNEVYGELFTKPYPARSCIGVADLPAHAAVEIECYAIDTTALEAMQGCEGCSGGSCEGCGGSCGD